jgi:glycosyltransferase involved in cell wall biosynthesis
VISPDGKPDADPSRHRVGILVTDNRRRGAEVQAERTAEGLQRIGWEVEFRSLASSPDPMVGAHPLTGLPRADLGRFDVPLLAPTRQFLRRQSGGVVLAWGSLTMRYVAATALLMRGRPRLGYVSIGSPLAWLSSRRALASYRLIASRYDFIIAVSQRTKHELVDAVGIPSGKVSVINSGVPERFLTIEHEAHTGPTRVIFVGSFSEEKDPVAAVRVFDIAAENADLSMTMVGDGPLHRAVEDLVMGREDRIALTGSVADISEHLATADIMLMTSKTEGIPGVLIEAAAAGVPVVTFGVGAVEEVVEHGSSGFVVRDRNIDTAARALVELARDDGLRRRFGDRARAIASERFLIGATVAETDRLLRDQLG